MVGLDQRDGGGADEGERHQRDSRRGEVANVEPAPLLRRRVGVVGVVDLLRQRLDRIEPEQVQRDADADQHRRRALEHELGAQPGDRSERRHPQEPRSGIAGEAAQVALPHRTGRVRRAGAAEPEPRRRTGAFAAQLPAQQHDRAQILHRDGEAELRNEVGPSRQRLEAQPIGERQRGDDGDDDHGDRDQVDDVAAHPPQAEAADAVARAGELPYRRGDLDADEDRAGSGRQPPRDAERVGDRRRRHERHSDESARDGAARGPRRGRARQPPRGELPGNAAGQGARERQRPQALADRPEQDGPPRHRCHHQVAGITGFE